MWVVATLVMILFGTTSGVALLPPAPIQLGTAPDLGQPSDFENRSNLKGVPFNQGYHETLYLHSIDNPLSGSNGVLFADRFLDLNTANVILDAGTAGILRTDADNLVLNDGGSSVTLETYSDIFYQGLRLNKPLALGGNSVVNVEDARFTDMNSDSTSFRARTSSGNLGFDTDFDTTYALEVRSDSNVEITQGQLILNNNRIRNVADPTSSQELATKSYVDSNAGGGYTAGNGVLLSGTEFSIDSPSCSSTETLRWTGATFVCDSTDISDSNEIQTFGEVLTEGSSAAGQTIDNVGTVRVDELYAGGNTFWQNNYNGIYVDESTDQLCFGSASGGNGNTAFVKCFGP